MWKDVFFSSEDKVAESSSPVRSVGSSFDEVAVCVVEVPVGIFALVEIVAVGNVVVSCSSVRLVGRFASVKRVAWTKVFISRRYETCFEEELRWYYKHVLVAAIRSK